MEPSATKENDLIAGILQDAKGEAEGILKNAETAVQHRAEAAKNQAEKILQDARKAAEEQSSAILRQVDDKIQMQKRRTALQMQDEIMKQVLEGVQARLGEQIGTSEYREILINWIVEAAIGLDAVSATVNASTREKECLDKDLLQDAVVRIKEVTGRDVTLALSEKTPTLLQGIVLQTAESSVEFNNHLSTRLVRYQSEIRRIVYDDLFDK